MGRGLSQHSKDILAAAERILEEIRPATVRGVCYRLFAEGLIKSMAKGETNKVGGLLTRAREEGTIPWGALVDDTRRPQTAGVWSAPSTFAEAVNDSFRLDPWETQPHRLEVWSEKGTVAGILAPVLSEYAVTFRVNRGFASATAVMGMVVEAERQIDKGQPLVALYVGDFDPSGLYMSDVDLPRRLESYAGDRENPVDLRRIALTETDLDGLPSFDVETKAGDPRYDWYVRTTREARAWELDAMNPNILRTRMETEILKFIDPEPWDRIRLVEDAQRQSLDAVMQGWAGLPIRGLDAE